MSVDPAVQAAIEAGEGHLPHAVGRSWSCRCGAPLPTDTLWAYEDHLTAVRVEAARPIWEAPIRRVCAELVADPGDSNTQNAAYEVAAKMVLDALDLNAAVGTGGK